MDFRLRIDYAKFKAGEDMARQRLLVNMLLRSLLILRENFLSEEGVIRLMEDVKATAREKEWLTEDL
jgi:hypothetical protein